MKKNYINFEKENKILKNEIKDINREVDCLFCENEELTALVEHYKILYDKLFVENFHLNKTIEEMNNTIENLRDEVNNSLPF